MNIRMLDEQDATLYWALRLEALKGNPEAFATSYEEAAMRENPVERTAQNLKSATAKTFGAFENGELVGMATLLFEKAEKLQHKGTVCAMYVAPDIRGQKVGQQLLAVLIETAAAKGLEQLNLSVVTANESAKKLYDRMGFEIYGVEKHALKSHGQYWDQEHRLLVLEK